MESRLFMHLGKLHKIQNFEINLFFSSISFVETQYLRWFWFFFVQLVSREADGGNTKRQSIEPYACYDAGKWKLNMFEIAMFVETVYHNIQPRKSGRKKNATDEMERKKKPKYKIHSIDE